MKVAVLGRTRILFDAIDKVINAGHEIVLIGTCKAAPEYDIVENDYENKAKELGVPFFCDARINSDFILDLLRESKADVAISVNWLTIIREEAINCFKFGILNAHCGDLPRYRGNACPNWAIINGENKIGISIHFMNPNELDSGDIVVKEFYPLESETTITAVYEYINNEIPRMFVEALSIVELDPQSIVPQSRNKEDILRCYPRIERDSYIDWDNDYKTIDKIVRASCHPFKGAYIYFQEEKYYIMRVSYSEFDTPCNVYPGQVVSINKMTHSVGVACRDGIVHIEEMKNEFGEFIKPEDVLYSMRMRVGYCVPDEIYNIKKEINEIRKIVVMGEKSNSEK